MKTSTHFSTYTNIDKDKRGEKVDFSCPPQASKTFGLKCKELGHNLKGQMILGVPNRQKAVQHLIHSSQNIKMLLLTVLKHECQSLCPERSIQNKPTVK